MRASLGTRSESCWALPMDSTGWEVKLGAVRTTKREVWFQDLLEFWGTASEVEMGWLEEVHVKARTYK